MVNPCVSGAFQLQFDTYTNCDKVCGQMCDPRRTQGKGTLE